MLMIFYTLKYKGLNAFQTLYLASNIYLYTSPLIANIQQITYIYCLFIYYQMLYKILK